MKFSSIFKLFDMGKIVSGANNTVQFVNKAIPIYKQMTPIVKNVRNAFSSVKSIKSAAKEATIKEIKSFERPVSLFKKKTLPETRNNINNGTLTFFQ